MTLAVIFLSGIFWFTSSPLAGMQPTSAQSGAGNQSAQDQSGPAQGQSPPANAKQPGSTSSSQSGAEKKKPPAKPVHHKKKASSGCDVSPAPASSNPETPSANDASTTTTQAGDNASGKGSATTTNDSKDKDCPPPKIVVRQGGSTEPAIQLAGGPPGTQASERENANQMLSTTEENLKKIGDRQLSTAEQDTVTQIHQFMDQSKTAIAAGDMKRASTLAWKAVTLSEDLANPKK